MRRDSLTFFPVSLIISAVILLTVLSFPEYFFFIPGVPDGFTIFSFMQVFSTLGWVSLILTPPLMLGFSNLANWGKVRSSLFLVGVTLWTAATLIVQIITLALYGEVWLEYMIVYPIFFFMSVIAPAIYITIWVRGHTINGARTSKHVEGK